ncbi:hypothetical protein EDB84DRAFT_1559271 [Lactarius hengduanensis]|nr:hypothetical protein EDB84DRAFT_1559271 [Lactarius hengduanensis]
MESVHLPYSASLSIYPFVWSDLAQLPRSIPHIVRIVRHVTSTVLLRIPFIPLFSQNTPRKQLPTKDRTILTQARLWPSHAHAALQPTNGPSTAYQRRLNTYPRARGHYARRSPTHEQDGRRNPLSVIWQSFARIAQADAAQLARLPEFGLKTVTRLKAAFEPPVRTARRTTLSQLPLQQLPLGLRLHLLRYCPNISTRCPRAT